MAARTTLCLLLFGWLAACGRPEAPRESADSRPRSVTDDRAAAEAPRVGAARSERTAGATPEFRLRLHPAQRSVGAEIDLDVSAPDSIHLLFRADWEGYPGLEDRLRAIEAFGPAGSLPVLRGAGQLGSGHHVVPVPKAQTVTVSFRLVLTDPPDSRFYHRASQIGSQGGHLLANDLLPRVWVGQPRSGRQPALVFFSGLPSAWRVATIEGRSGVAYAVEDISQAVFIIGQLRTQRHSIGPRTLTTAVYGDWPVADERVWDAVDRIAGNLHRIAGSGWRSGEHLLGAGRVPSDVPGHSTGGQVIGRSGIVYVGGQGAPELEFRRWLYTTAHELTHWYIPIGFRFAEEPPAWFAEGFTDYMALKTLLVGGLIDPEEFLFEVGQRLRRYRSSPLYGTRSIADAQADFWQDDAYRYIYDGGAVAAFFLDLGFRDRGSSLEHVLRDLSNGPVIDTPRLQQELASVPENRWIGEWLAEGTNPDWDHRLATYRLQYQNRQLISLDDWATDALSSIRP